MVVVENGNVRLCTEKRACAGEYIYSGTTWTSLSAGRDTTRFFFVVMNTIICGDSKHRVPPQLEPFQQRPAPDVLLCGAA